MVEVKREKKKRKRRTWNILSNVHSIQMSITFLPVGIVYLFSFSIDDSLSHYSMWMACIQVVLNWSKIALEQHCEWDLVCTLLFVCGWIIITNRNQKRGLAWCNNRYDHQTIDADNEYFDSIKAVNSKIAIGGFYMYNVAAIDSYRPGFQWKIYEGLFLILYEANWVGRLNLWDIYEWCQYF